MDDAGAARSLCRGSLSGQGLEWFSTQLRPARSVGTTMSARNRLHISYSMQTPPRLPFPIRRGFSDSIPAPPGRTRLERSLRLGTSRLVPASHLAGQAVGRTMGFISLISLMRGHLARLNACWLAALGGLCCLSTASAQDVSRTPLPSQHPLVGTWRIDLPGTQCYEVYTFKEDGTTSLTSGAQRAETEFEMDLQPSAKGFYKWVDKVTKDNGRPDCLGSVVELGHVAINYILVGPTRRDFLLCSEEDLDSCVGPFRRQDIDV